MRPTALWEDVFPGCGQEDDYDKIDQSVNESDSNQASFEVHYCACDRINTFCQSCSGYQLWSYFFSEYI